MSRRRTTDLQADARVANLKLLGDARVSVSSAVVKLCGYRPTEAAVHLAQAQRQLLALEKELTDER